MAAPTNISAATARLIGWGETGEDVSEAAGPDYQVWFKYIGKANEILIGLWVHASPLTATYHPRVTVYEADGVTALTSLSNTDSILNVPIVPGATYYFKVRTLFDLGAPDAPLVVSVVRAPTGIVPAGALFVNDDTDVMPGALLDPVSGETLGYRNLVGGEGGETLPSGFTLLTNESADTIVLYDDNLDVVAVVPLALTVSLPTISSNRVDRFYVNDSTTTAVGTITAVDLTGAILDTWSVPTYGAILKGAAPSRDDTILYYIVATGSLAIRRWDLVNDVALSDLTAGTGTGSYGHDVLVLDDGTIVVSRRTGTASVEVDLYTPAGALIATYPIVPFATFLNHLSHAVTGDSFWIWVNVEDAIYSDFFQVRVSDGAILADVTSAVFYTGESSQVPTPPTGADAIRFGSSGSCPLMVSRSAITVPKTFGIAGFDSTDDATALIHPVDNPTPGDCCDKGTGPIATPDDTVPLAEWEPECDGGGLAPDADPVVNSENWRNGLQAPDVWVGCEIVDYPSGDTTTERIATKAMVYPNRIEGRAVERGYSDIEHALTDWRGNPEAAVFGAMLNDADGVWRGIAERIGTTAKAKAATSVYLLSEAGRHAGLTERVIQRGYLTRPPTPAPGRKAKIESVDVAGSAWFRLNPERPLQTFVWTRPWLEGAGLVNTPKATLGQPAYAFLGEHSDKGAVDAFGNSAEKGVRPVQDLGDQIVTEEGVIDTVNTNIEHIPPPVWVGSPTVDGVGGSETYQYAFVAAFEGGQRTVVGEVKSVNGCPAYGELTSSNRVRIEWEAPAGWEAYYEAHCIGVYLCGRRNANATYLDIGRHAILGDGLPDWTPGGLGTGVYYDDQDRDVEKPLPNVGDAVVVTSTPGDPETITTSRVRGVFFQGLAWEEIHALYGPSREEGAPSRRVFIDPDDPDIEIPTEPITFGPAGDEITGTLFYASNQLLNLVRNGGVSFATNGCGVTADGTPDTDPLTEMSEGYIWVVDQLLLAQYRNGVFWPSGLQQFPDGMHIMHTALIRIAQAKTVEWIGGRGYQMHLALTEPTTFVQFERWFNTTFNTFTGELDDGRRALWLMDAEADVSAGYHYQQHIQLGTTLPEPKIAEDEVENRIQAHYDYDPDAKHYRGDVEMIESEDSQAIYGIRDAVKGENGQPGFLEQRCTRDRTTARDAMARRLFWNKVAPLYQPFPTDYVGMEETLGNVIRASHTDGLGVSGYVNRPFFVVRKRIGVNGPNQRVTLTSSDMYRAVVAAEASVMADDGLGDGGAAMDFAMMVGI